MNSKKHPDVLAMLLADEAGTLPRNKRAKFRRLMKRSRRKRNGYFGQRGLHGKENVAPGATDINVNVMY